VTPAGLETPALASLDHPHIVPVFDVGTTEDGLPFVVSKLVEGSDLEGTSPDERPPAPTCLRCSPSLQPFLRVAKLNP
jgi:serine/threonine protein kinase